MERQSMSEGSHYHIRKEYLQALKQFMSENQTASRRQLNDMIDEYILYEKQVSSLLTQADPPLKC
jgi:hypothetical protein